MTRNRFDDNTPAWAGSLNTIMNAHDLEGIEAGCSPAKGSGDWDVDVASGTVRIGFETAAVSASTVTLTQPSNDGSFDSGETRVDLVHIDNSGTVSKTEGTPASDPTTPNIPTGEAVVALVVIEHSDATLSDAIINDERNLLRVPIDPLYGDTSDGTISRSSNANENGLVYADRYTVESGTTMTVSNGVLVVHATQKIDISGTIDASGQGAAGGGGGSETTATNNGNAGSTGTQGRYIGGNGTGGGGGGSGADGSDGSGSAAGGGGGGGLNTSGGSGADGRDEAATANQVRQLRQLMSAEYGNIYDLSAAAGSGGGGGGSGGGGDGSGETGGAGGDGGAGGGVVVLIAPEIDVSGTVDCSGADGSTGSDGSNNDAGGGGGGGGGDGGVAVLASTVLSETGTVTAAGGSGGAGGSPSSADGGAGGAGSGGEAGLTLHLGAQP